MLSIGFDIVRVDDEAYDVERLRELQSIRILLNAFLIANFFTTESRARRFLNSSRLSSHPYYPPTKESLHAYCLREHLLINECGRSSFLSSRPTEEDVLNWAVREEQLEGSVICLKFSVKQQWSKISLVTQSDSRL